MSVCMYVCLCSSVTFLFLQTLSSRNLSHGNISQFKFRIRTDYFGLVFYMYLYRISRRPLKGETDRETIIFGLGLGALTTWPIHQQWPSKAFQISRKYIKVSFQMGVPKTCQWKVICLHFDPCGGRQLFCVFIRAVWPVLREIAREDSLWER